MKILGIDSSGLVASVAIVEDDILVGEYTTNYKKTHSQTLLPMLDELKLETQQIPAEGTYTGKIVTISGVESGVLVPDLEKNREILMAIAECDRIDRED